METLVTNNIKILVNNGYSLGYEKTRNPLFKRKPPWFNKNYIVERINFTLKRLIQEFILGSFNATHV